MFIPGHHPELITEIAGVAVSPAKADKQEALQRRTNAAIAICQKSVQYQNFVSVTLHPASQTQDPALLLIFQVLPVTFPDCCHTQAILLQDSAPDM